MKKSVFAGLFLFAILTISLIGFVRADTCTDSGDDFYTKDLVTISKSDGTSFVREDTCLDDGRVQEQLCCDCENYVGCKNTCSKYLQCPNGCYDGRCLNEGESVPVTSITIPIYKGWNLIPLMSGESQQPSSSVKTTDFKYVYIYDILQKRYILLGKNGEMMSVNDAGLQFREGDTELSGHYARSSVWAYSEKEGSLILSLSSVQNRESLTLSNFKLNQGWNLIFINPAMGGKSLSQIKGDCNIQKVASYISGSWRTLFDINGEKNNDKVTIITGESIGFGIVMKVSSDCTLGSTSEGISPPELP